MSRGAPPSLLPTATWALGALALCVGFVALGTWQLERRVWKLALIDRVSHRVHAPPVPAPDPARWPQVSAATDEYRHVTVTGVFLHESATLVQAVTALGAGYWVLTPLRLADGSIVLVNRGFVPPELRGRSARRGTEPPGTTTVVGLLRMTEPGGAFLRHNDPGANRWYSRDVQAIASSRGLGNVAPYFIDADAAESSGSAPTVPIGGLTVIAFHNDHLMYAITWYTLALLAAGAAVAVIRARHDRRGN